MEMDFTMDHAMNLIRFMISSELNVVQGKVYGSPEPKVVLGANPKEIL